MALKREYPAYIVPHSDYGSPDCCGLIMASPARANETHLRCNECGDILKTVPAGQAEEALEAMGGETASMYRAMPLLQAYESFYWI